MERIEGIVRITKDHCPPQEQKLFEWDERAQEPAGTLSYPGLEINLEQRRVFKNGQEVCMSRYEYGVLSLMAQHPGQLFTKEQIFEAVWQQDSESCLTAVTNTIGRMIPVNRKFLRGDIYYANLEPHLGSEQGGIRPVVVVQNNTANCYSPNLIVAPVTSNTAKKPDHQAHVLVDGNRAFLQPSMILAESVQTISKGRLIRPMGRLSIPELIRLNYALLYQLDLNEWVWRKEAYERYLRYHR